MKRKLDKIDWIVTVLPFLSILIITALLFKYPMQSNRVISNIRLFFTDTFGIFYLILGFSIFLVSIYLAFSKYGNIVLGGRDEKPKFSFFTWGSMMFTCGLAADILFYSFIEWTMYVDNPHVSEFGNAYEWAGVFPIFHWSFIPWAFYLVLAVVFGFMLHVRKKNKKRFSEACRPLLNKNSEKITGSFIDLFAIFALIAGTATTFSVATPLMSEILIRLLGLKVNPTFITITILLLTCFTYTYACLYGIKGMSVLSKMCIYLFFSFLITIFLIGGQYKFILENGLQSLGKMVQHFIELSTYTDPLRRSNFPQDWTIYYWSYWIVWCVAAPFFIGSISKGRKIRQVILGGYTFGVGSTLLSFIILGNYGLGLQVFGKADFITNKVNYTNNYSLILDIMETIPFSKILIIVLFICMVAFYATSFDSIAYTASCYSYKSLREGEEPNRIVILMWCILIITLPIALVFSESSMTNIQSISIIAAFPIGIIIIMMVISFFKDAKLYIKDNLK